MIAHRSTGNVDDSVLIRLNDELETNTCLTGNNVTVADVMLFYAVRTKVVGLVKGPCDNLCHVVRWFDYMQYLPFVAAVPVPIRALGIFDVEVLLIVDGIATPPLLGCR